jgi:exopolysaccharide biosynthesis protein
MTVSFVRANFSQIFRLPLRQARPFVGRFLFVVTIFLSTGIPCWCSAELQWKDTHFGIQVATASFDDNSFLSPTFTLIKIDLTKVDLHLLRAPSFGVPRMEIKSLVESSRAIGGINASYFDENGNALGLLISRGILHQKIHRGGNTITSIFSMKGTIPEIAHRGEFISQGVTEALQAGPRLIANNVRIATVKDTNYSRRSGVCIINPRSVVFFITSSGFLGATLGQVQRFLLSDDLRCKDALNFDGGGSSQLYFRDLPEHSTTGDDAIPVALAVFAREDQQHPHE